jgi:hypothetical protein
MNEGRSHLVSAAGALSDSSGSGSRAVARGVGDDKKLSSNVVFGLCTSRAMPLENLPTLRACLLLEMATLKLSRVGGEIP